MNPIITYQRDGIIITVDQETVTIKKNGLTIGVPFWMIEDFANELSKESNDIHGIARELGLRNAGNNRSNNHF